MVRSIGKARGGFLPNASRRSASVLRPCVSSVLFAEESRTSRAICVPNEELRPSYMHILEFLTVRSTFQKRI